MFVNFVAVIVLAVSGIAASPTPTPIQSVNPPTSALQARGVQHLSQMRARELTNAKRLALGLPLNPPKLRRSPTVQAAASARPSPSGSPATTGYIQVVESDSDKSLGFVGKQLNSFGEYGHVAESEDDALKVKFNLDTASRRSTDIVTINGPEAEYPFFGAINGYASTSYDIGPGSPNYQYFGATKQTSAYSPPSSPGNSFTAATKISQTSESAIFRYNETTHVIKARYVNTDHTKPRTYAGINKDDVLVLTGDKSAFTASFGSAVWVTFKFVPA